MNPEQKDRADELAEKVRLQCDTIDVEIPSDVVDDIVDDYVADVIRQRESELSLQHQEREAAMLEQFHHLVDVADGYLQVKEFLKEDRFDLTNAKVILDRRDNQVRKERTKAEKNFPVETERSKDGDVHTMPTFDGFDHESDSNCGCRPEVCYTAPNGNRVWLHKVIQ